MTIKSLLLGSAAALVAVSGARAADAVMAEPEAVEYVRVCDAYGAGYFYIPGTETCLKIAGRVRYQINYNSNEDSFFDVTGNGLTADDIATDGWVKQAQAMLNFTAKSDTELGTLTSYIEMEANALSGLNGGDAIVNSKGAVSFNKAFTLSHAWISLGGLKMGYSDTLFDGGINGEFDSFGGSGVHFMGYTFSSGNGFSFTLNLEQETYDTDYLPNVVAKASYTQGGYTLDAWAAYDDKDIPGFKDEFALKAILTAKVSDPFTLQLGATYNSGPSFYSNGADWSLGASGKFQANEKLAVTLGAQYFGGDYTSGDGEWAAGVVVDYTVVPQFLVELAVNYKSDDNAGVIHGDQIDGYLRFQREF
jgi:Porin subfamily